MQRSDLPPYDPKLLFDYDAQTAVEPSDQPSSVFGQEGQTWPDLLEGKSLEQIDQLDRGSAKQTDREVTFEELEQIERDLAKQAMEKAEEEAEEEAAEEEESGVASTGETPTQTQPKAARKQKKQAKERRARTKTVPGRITAPKKQVDYGQEGDRILDVDGLLAELRADEKNQWLFQTYGDDLNGDDLQKISKILEANVARISWESPTIIDPASFQYVDTDLVQYTFQGRSPFFQNLSAYGVSKSDAKTSFEIKRYEPGIVLRNGVPHVRVRRLLKRNNTEYVVDEPATLHPNAEKQATSTAQSQKKQQRAAKKQRGQTTLEESEGHIEPGRRKKDTDEDYVPSDVEEDESASAEDESYSESLSSSPEKKRAKQSGKRGKSRRREKHAESATAATVETLDQPLKIGEAALAFLRIFLQPSAEKKLDYATVFGAAAGATSAASRVATKSRPAVPTLRPAAPTLRPAAPTLRPAAPTLRTAVPTLRPAVPTLRPAVSSRAAAVAAKDAGAPIPRVSVVEPPKSPKSQKISNCIDLGKDYINSRMSQYKIYHMDPKTGKELDNRAKCKKIVEHEEKLVFETQNASTSTRK